MKSPVPKCTTFANSEDTSHPAGIRVTSRPAPFTEDAEHLATGVCKQWNTAINGSVHTTRID